MTFVALLLVLQSIFITGAFSYLLNIFVKFFLNLTLLQSWNMHSATYFSFNAVSWYLSVCLFIYFVFPYILKFMKKHKNYGNAYVSIVMVYAVQIVLAVLSSLVNLPLGYSDNFCKWFTYIFPLFRLGDFIIGCNLGYIIRNRCKRPDTVMATIFEIITIGLIVISVVLSNNSVGFLGSEYIRYSIIFLPISVLLVYLFYVKKGFVSNILTNKPLIFIGNLSAYTFLIHQIVIKFVRAIFYNKLAIVALSITLTIITAIIYIKFEKTVKTHFLKKAKTKVR